MTFANPIFLWSLLGLSVPIAIHLLSQKEGQIIRLGSIRHVQETSTQQFKGIRLNEILLLLLRCAMIIALSLFLSGLQCSRVTNKKWVVVEGGLEKLPAVKTIVDSLRSDGYEQHQLSDGFPIKSVDSTRLSYWELARQLEEKSLEKVVVLASNRLENFSGKRVALPDNIKWIAAPLSNVDFPLQAIQISKDSIFLRTGHSGANETSFSTERVESAQTIPVSPPDSIRIAIVTDEAYQYDRRISMAALNTIAKSFAVRIKIRESNSSKFSLSNSDWCIWLSDKNIPANNSINLIQMQPVNASELITQSGSNVWFLTKRLNEDVALEENLMVQLVKLIVPSKQLNESAQANDRRTMPDSMAWSTREPIKSAGVVSSSAGNFLMITLLILLLVERIIAYRRSQ